MSSVFKSRANYAQRIQQLVPYASDDVDEASKLDIKYNLSAEQLARVTESYAISQTSDAWNGGDPEAEHKNWVDEK